MTRNAALTGWRGRALGQLASIFAIALLAAVAVALLPTASMAQTRADRGYVLGPNDGVTVIVYGQQEFNVQTRVKPDGSIVMPLIGRVQASGKNVIELADEVRSRLVAGNFLREPIVNVEVTDFRSQYARVVGKVGQPGLVPLDQRYRVLDLLLRAGWVQQGGANFVLMRRGSDNKEIRLETDALARGGAGSDIYVEPGDTLFVDDAELVFLTGQVARPGPYALEPGMTIANLIARAGGVGPTGSSGRFGLKRGKTEQTVDEDAVLQKDDVVDVRERLF
jgi:polysaccharide export outer membrane protein